MGRARLAWPAVVGVPLAAGSGCLPGAVVAPRMVEYRGAAYPLPIARGGWASPEVPFQIIDILLREKMGIQTAAVLSWSSEELLRQVSGCSDASLACTEQERADGRFREPPDVWAANEVWGSTVEERRLRELVYGGSFTGYIGKPGLYALPSAFADASGAGVLLGFWEALLDPGAKSCCFSNVSAVQAAVNYTSQMASGTDGYTRMEALGFADHIQDGWYIATACRHDVRTCIPVILEDFVWAMREWVDVAEANSLPFALISFGWDFGPLVVRELASIDMSFLFAWWQPDSTFRELSPRMVLFQDELLTIKQFQPTEKILWSKILEVDRGDDILSFYSRVTFTDDQVNGFVTRQMNASEEAWSIACEWILGNEATWGTWIPDATNCEKGFFYDNASEECTGCAPGTFAANRGMTECVECGAGEFQAQVGKTDCEPCLAGTRSDGAAAACEACATGQWQNETGQRQCKPCDEGGQLTTLFPGSTSEDECLCPQGSYRPLEAAGGALCRPCPEGTTCALGSDERNIVQGSGPLPAGAPASPRLTPGYMSLATEPLRVFRCLPEGYCPGGGTASCALLRDSREPSCGVCESGSYSSGGECRECDGAFGVLPCLLAVGAALLGLAALTFVVNRKLALQPSSTMLSVAMLALLFGGIQTLGVFRQLSIEWSGPLGEMLSFVALLSFDFEILRLGCVVGPKPTSAFVLRQLVAPCCVPIICIAVVLKKRVWKIDTDIRVELLNTVGTLFNTFFISILISGVSPFICYQHPSGDWSMVSSSSILCFQGSKHSVLMLSGILSLCAVPLPFLVGSCFFIWNYPSYMMGLKGQRSPYILQGMRFLYFRFNPHRYFYGIFLLFRSIAICLVPVAFPDDVALQVLTIGFVLCFATLFQQQLNPWRAPVANVLDGILSMMLVLLLFSGGILAEVGADQQAAVESMGLSIVVLIVLVSIVTTAWCLYDRFARHSWYSYFITHHKAHAAAQARLLKMVLQAKTSQSVFIDSDDLIELDGLFDIVKCRVKHLVVYLTKDTLSRPWCAGEIVTAFLQKGKVKMTAVRTPSFQPLTETQLETIDEYVDHSGLASCSLEEYHMSFDDVRNAYRELLSTRVPQIRLEEHGGLQHLYGLADLLSSSLAPVEDGGLSLSLGSDSNDLPRLAGALQDAVVISSDPSDMEAAASAAILKAMIQERVLALTEKGTVLVEDFGREEPAFYRGVAKQAHCTVLLLSQGSMQSESQLQTIVGAMCAGDGHASQSSGSSGAVIVPVFIDGFQLPGDSYYEEELPRLFPGLAGEGRPFILGLFKTIAVHFSPSASERVLETQCEEVFGRIPARGVGSGSIHESV